MQAKMKMIIDIETMKAVMGMFIRGLMQFDYREVEVTSVEETVPGTFEIDYQWRERKEKPQKSSADK